VGKSYKTANRTPQVGLDTRIDRMPSHPAGTAADPLLPYQIWKIRKSTLKEFQREAKAQGRRTIPSLIREVLDGQAARWRKRGARQAGKAAGTGTGQDGSGSGIGTGNGTKPRGNKQQHQS
jgi:hypothetical protein